MALLTKIACFYLQASGVLSALVLGAQIHRFPIAIGQAAVRP